MSWRAERFCLALAAAVACGGNTAPGGGSGGEPLDVIDDMESFDLKQARGRNVEWAANSGGPPPGKMFGENANENDPPASVDDAAPLDPKRNNSQHAALFTSPGAYVGYGPSLQLWFVGHEDSPTKSYDVSCYLGVRFWIRATGISKLQLQLADVRTDPSNKEAFPDTCDVTAAKPNGCYDRFSTDVALSPEWRAVKVRWSDLTQAQFARMDPGPDLKRALSLNFQIDPLAKAELWIDDVAFINGPQGVGERGCNAGTSEP